MNAFDEVIDPEPLTVVYDPLDFIPHVRVCTPVARVRPYVKHGTGIIPQRVWSKAKLDCGIKDKMPEVFGGILSNGDLTGLTRVSVTPRKRFCAAF